NGGTFAAHGTAHVAIAIHGRRPRGTEGRDDDLVLATAAAASVARTIEAPQSGVRWRRGPAFVLRPGRPAFALLGLFGPVAVATAHAGVDVPRARAGHRRLHERSRPRQVRRAREERTPAVPDEGRTPGRAAT